jgi:O-antigen ligase
MNHASSSALDCRAASHPEQEGVLSFTSLCAFLLGLGTLGLSIFIGAPDPVSLMVIFFAFLVTVLCSKNPLFWVFLASMLAANPLNWSAVFSCNVIFAFWLILFKPTYLLNLPRWLYLPGFLALVAFSLSSLNWLSDNTVASIRQQAAYLVSYFLGPLILLPLIYLRMGSESDAAKLKGLLYFLIVPSTLLLFLTHHFGSRVPIFNSDLHVVMRFGNTLWDFTRTHLGFLLSALICASSAIIVTRVNLFQRLVSVCCLAMNLLLLLVTGSVGSSIACLGGIAAMFLVMLRKAQMLRLLVAMLVLVALFLSVWHFSSGKIREYAQQRYHERFSDQGIHEDRSALWRYALDGIYEHPAGTGWSLVTGEGVKKNPHNDYLLFAANYGVLGGIIYAYLILRLQWHFFRSAKSVSDGPYLQVMNLTGLGVVTALLINSFSDHLVANKWFFNVVWSLVWYAYFCGRAQAAAANRPPELDDFQPLPGERSCVK